MAIDLLTWGAAGSLILLFYYLTIWLRYKPRSVPAPLIGWYEPPEGVSPATARCVFIQGLDGTGLASMIVNMAAKGFVSIEEREFSFTVRKMEVGKERAQNMSRQERAIDNALFSEESSVRLDGTRSRRAKNARDALEKIVNTEIFENFPNKYLLIYFGIFLTAAASILFWPISVLSIINPIVLFGITIAVGIVCGIPKVHNSMFKKQELNWGPPGYLDRLKANLNTDEGFAELVDSMSDWIEGLTVSLFFLAVFTNFLSFLILGPFAIEQAIFISINVLICLVFSSRLLRIPHVSIKKLEELKGYRAYLCILEPGKSQYFQKDDDFSVDFSYRLALDVTDGGTHDFARIISASCAHDGD